jgi:RNA polymerase sigma-70 factor (ECF subfamily)
MRSVLPDEQVVDRVLAGERELFELLMRRYNRRLFRTLRALLRDEDAAEEALQQTWIEVWRGLAGFAGRANFSTWATRIALRTAAHATHREQRLSEVAQDLWTDSATSVRHVEPVDDGAARREVVARIERAIEALPEAYRVVLVLRAVEGLSTAEVGHALGLDEGAVKVRLHRARERLERDLRGCVEGAELLAEAWAFDGLRCNRVVARVLERARDRDF